MTDIEKTEKAEALNKQLANSKATAKKATAKKATAKKATAKKATAKKATAKKAIAKKAANSLNFEVLKKDLETQFNEFNEEVKKLNPNDPEIMATFEGLTSKNFGYVPAALKWYLFNQLIK